MTVISDTPRLNPKDFASDQEVRWCPGCGDYAILKATQRALAELGCRPERTVFVSGIGCSSRFPYYMATYGFHTIHGRAPAVASGIKLANPNLDVWVVTGDGDGLSIGGNHTLHVLRRNVDLQILLFNNEIYGLTKGQYSPTSRTGTRSPSSPEGSHDRPLLPAQVALGAGARFVARAIDTSKGLVDVLKAAHGHRGASFVEIFQNCIVYNDEVFASFTAREVAASAQLWVQHGQPLVYGAPGQRRGLRLKPGRLELESVVVGEGGITENDLIVHDATNRPLAMLLAALQPPAMPMVLGVLYDDPAPAYAIPRIEAPDRATLADRINQGLRQGDTWVVDGHAP